MSLTGEQLGARFSYNCWTSRIKGFKNLLEEFARYGNNYEKAIKALQKLSSFAWYEIIAKRNSIDNPFDVRVVRAYWIGDESLVRPIKFNENILLPFHNFTVLGDIHRYRGITVEDIDKCKVSVAKVCGINRNQIHISHQALAQRGEGFSLMQNPKIISIKKGFVEGVETEDWVVYHEGVAVDVLSEKEALALIRRTKEAIKLFNRQQV